MPTPPAADVAALVAVTDEARAALGGKIEVRFTEFPFKVGRESRSNSFERLRSEIERRIGGLPPLNNLYLLEPPTESLHTSREHFVIDCADGRYVLTDRGSTCGTIVADHHLDGGTLTISAELHSGDLIVVGSSHSPYVFRFEVRAGGPPED